MEYTFFPDSIALEKYDASVSKITSQLKKIHKSSTLEVKFATHLKHNKVFLISYLKQILTTRCILLAQTSS